MFGYIEELFRSNRFLITFISIVILAPFVGYLYNRRLQNIKQKKEEDKEAREVTRENIKYISSLIDKIIQNGEKYWISNDVSIRNSHKVYLIAHLKELGPSVQNLFPDTGYRRQAVGMVKTLRQTVMKGDFEYPDNTPVPEPKTAARIAKQAIDLKNFVKDNCSRYRKFR